MGDGKVRAAVLWWSAGGNTRKVAEAVEEALTAAGVVTARLQITPDLDVDFRDYTLTFIAVPVYHYLPPKPAMEFLHAQQRAHAAIQPSAPQRPGRYAVMVATYGGPHTGDREAVPTLKYMGQFFEHDGIDVVDEWAVVGHFHEASQEPMNLQGRLGDIRGRPNAHDLAEVKGRVGGLLRRLRHMPGLEPLAEAAP